MLSNGFIDAGLLSPFNLTPQTLIGFIVFFPLIALSLTVHEFFHAYSADRMGDPTGRYQGRCTLDPFAHLDPIGTIALLFAPMGWARPVPVNPLNFANPARGMIISVAAGPLSNLGLAAIAGILIRLLGTWTDAEPTRFGLTDAATPSFVIWTYAALGAFLMMNVWLALFNLIPLYPLDGHHLVRETLRGDAQRRFTETQHLGIFVLLGLLLIPSLLDVESPITRILSGPAMKIMTLFAGKEGMLHSLIAREMLSAYFPW